MIRIKRKIDKAEVTAMPPVIFEGRIIVIQTEAEADKAVDYLLSQTIVGVDTETRPSFKKGQSHKVALLQVATLDTCFLFRINIIGLCTSILRFIADKKVIKVGLSLKDDFLSLHRHGEFKVGSFVELQTFVREIGIADMSLQKIYAILFSQRISKNQRLSNWESDVLTDKQKSYAAIDAWACVRIYSRVKELRENGEYKLEPLPEAEDVIETSVETNIELTK